MKRFLPPLITLAILAIVLPALSGAARVKPRVLLAHTVNLHALHKPPLGKLDATLSQLPQAPSSQQTWREATTHLPAIARVRRNVIRVEVRVNPKASTPAVGQSIDALPGVSVERRYRNLLQVSLPIPSLHAIAATPNVVSVRAPLPFQPAAVTDEGVGATGASAWRAAGITGAGAWEMFKRRS